MAGQSDDFKAHFDKIWQDKMAGAAADLVKSMDAPINKLVKEGTFLALEPLNQRVGKVEEGVADLQDGQGRLQDKVDQLSKQIADLSTKLDNGIGSSGSGSGTGNGGVDMGSMSGANGSSPPTFLEGGFFRTPNPTLLFCNTLDDAKVTRAQFHASFAALALEAGIAPDKYLVSSDAIDCRFDIKFLGPQNEATSNCAYFYSSLQLGKGRWKPQNVVGPSQESVQFFVGPDKSPGQVKREVVGKALREFIESKIGPKKVYIRKTSGSIFVDRRLLCVVLISGETTGRLEWSHTKRIELGLSQEDVELKLSALCLGEGLSSS